MDRRTRAQHAPWLAVVFGAMCSVSIAAGTALTAPGALPDGPFGLWAGLLTVRGHTASELVYVLRLWGFIGLLAAWFWLRSASRGCVVVAAVAWMLPMLALPPGEGDLFNYVDQGWVVLQGGNPTTLPAGSMAGPFSDWVGS